MGSVWVDNRRQASGGQHQKAHMVMAMCNTAGLLRRQSPPGCLGTRWPRRSFRVLLVEICSITFLLTAVSEVSPYELETQMGTCLIEVQRVLACVTHMSGAQRVRLQTQLQDYQARLPAMCPDSVFVLVWQQCKRLVIKPYPTIIDFRKGNPWRAV